MKAFAPFSRVLFYLGCLFLLRLETCLATSPAKYDGKPLTFTVENKNLGQVLEIFKEKTGMDYEVPGELKSSGLPLVEIKNLTTKKALLMILEGTNTDYILVASPNDPERITKLLILGRSTAIASNSGPAANASSSRSMNRPPVAEDPFGGDMNVDEGQAEAPPINVAPTPATPPPPGVQQNPMGIQPGQQTMPNQPGVSQQQPGQNNPQSTPPVSVINPYATPDNRKSPF
ncbi:MAG: hypothetical protein U0V70_13865 [Terriglobia bacterium]